MEVALRTIAVGDIHGCIHALDKLLELIAPHAEDTLVFLGDFVDQGRDSRYVLDRLIALSAECHVISILGNHEEMLLESLHNEKARQAWLNAGGHATLNSYYFGAGIDVIPDDHLAFLRSCRDFYQTDTHIFTHAGYDPQLKMEQQPEYELRWALLEEPYPAPHTSGKTVVVGHTEQASGEPLDLGHLVCIDTACWRYGWLTALDVGSGERWQVSRWGVPRDDFAAAG